MAWEVGRKTIGRKWTKNTRGARWRPHPERKCNSRDETRLPAGASGSKELEKSIIPKNKSWKTK